jgi:hypothetical protein
MFHDWWGGGEQGVTETTTYKSRNGVAAFSINLTEKESHFSKRQIFECSQ